MEEYGSIQQLKKKEPGAVGELPIYPTTMAQAVYDAKTGASLEAILAQYNNIYVQYQGSAKDTRNIIPVAMRRAGMMITYMTMDGETITERAASAVQKDNDHWGLDVNWTRIDELSLAGDISVTAQGTWVINGEDTKVAARGPKGDNGLTPWLKTINNKLHYSYDNVTWEVCSEPIAAYFRWSGNKIQISRDNKTWSDLSGEFADNLRIKGYVATKSALPSSASQGDIYGVGPTYAEEDAARTNPIYRYYVRNASAWVDNGSFTSIAAGIVQETGEGENVVMSQKAVTEKLSELGSEVGFYPRPGLIANGKWYDTTNGRHLLIPISSQDIITVNPKTATYYTLLSDYTNAVDGESAMFATGYTDRIVIDANKDVVLYNSDAKYLYLALGSNTSSLVEYNTISINGNDIKGYISNAWALSLATKTSALNQRIEDISNPLNRFLFTNHYYLIANGKWNSYNFGAKCSIIAIIPSDKITITPNAATYYSILRSYNQPLSDTDVVDFASGYSDRVSFDKEISFVASEDANYLYIADLSKINSIKINDIDVTSIYNSLDMLQHPNIGKIAPYLTTGIPNANNEMWYDANSSHMVIDVQSGSIIDLVPNEGKSIYYFFFKEYVSPISPKSTHPILSEECVGLRPFTYNERVSLVVPYDAKYLYIHAINTSCVKDILINGVSVYRTTIEQIETVRKNFTSMEGVEYKSSMPLVNYYPNILDKCPRFRDKLANMEDDLTVLILGDSLSAMHRNKQTDAKNMPCQMTRYTWDYWMWKYTNNSDVIGRRYDSGVFTEVGSFSSGYELFAEGLPTWSRDENDDASTTRYSTDAAASVTFVWNLPLYEKCHFIHRMDVRGCSSVKISIKEGNGRVRVFNGESWVEANGFEFSQYINSQDAYEGSGKSQTLANWRLKFKRESLNGTATITISKNVADSSYFFYWGYEMWNGNRLIFVNNAHGGREFGYFKNHMLSFKSRKPDLVICQNMLINEYSDAIAGDNGNEHSGQTIVNNAWDMIYGDRQGNENALSLQSISNNWEDFEVINIIPHFRYEYFNKDEVSFKTTFDNGYVDMTCWKVWEKVKNLHISKGKAVIDISKVWKNEALMRGWTHRQSYANAGFETNTNAGWESLDGFTHDTVHQNTYGHRIWAKYIATIFD